MGQTATVIFIASDSRSGSTLLDLSLGQVAGIVSVGELRYLWERGFHQNMLCGCGRPFRDCGFWTEVLRHAFGSDLMHRVQYVTELQRAVDRPDRFLLTQHFRAARFAPAYRSKLREYQAALGEVFSAVRVVSGCSVIVDASKAPGHGMLLRGVPGVRLKVIHLVRDARAVAHSLQRKKERPEVHWTRAFMPTYSPAKGALRWTIVNQIFGRFQKTVPYYSFMRYEQFAQAPSAELRRVLTELEIGPQPLDFIADGVINIKETHGISGNPVRFGARQMKVRVDVAWRTEMPRSKRLIVGMIAWPELRRRGYC